MPTKWSGQFGQHMFFECSADFAGEFIEMFLVDVSSSFDGCESFQDIFLDVSEQMLTGDFCVTFCVDHVPQLFCS